MKTGSELALPEADEEELNSAAIVLTQQAQGTDAQRQAGMSYGISLLQSYLKSSRTKTQAQELQARLLLAQVFYKQKKWREAREVIDANYPAPSTTDAKTRSIYNDVQKLREKLNSPKNDQ